MNAEYWGFIIALCTVGILYIVSDMLHESAREMRPAYQWGEKQRKPPKEATWARHDLLAAVTFLADFVILKTVLAQ